MEIYTKNKRDNNWETSFNFEINGHTKEVLKTNCLIHVLIINTVNFNLFTLKFTLKPSEMWALEIRFIQCALCLYLSVHLCDSTQQRGDVAAKNTGNMRRAIMKIKCVICWDVCQEYFSKEDFKLNSFIDFSVLRSLPDLRCVLFSLFSPQSGLKNLHSLITAFAMHSKTAGKRERILFECYSNYRSFCASALKSSSFCLAATIKTEKKLLLTEDRAWRKIN